LDVPEAWEILLSKCSMFVRDSSGVSGLSAMIDGLQYAMFTKYVKSYLIAVGSGKSFLTNQKSVYFKDRLP